MLTLCAGSVFAQSALPPSVSAEIAQVEASLARGGLNEAQVARVNEALNRARGFELQAEAALQASSTLRTGVADAERERRALERELGGDSAQAFRQWRQALPAALGTEQVEAQIADERTEVQALRANASELRATLSVQSSDLLADVGRDAELSLQIDSLKRRVDSPVVATDEPQALQQASQAALKAELRALLAEQAQRELERSTAPVRRAHLELKLRLAQRNLGDREQRLTVLESLSSERQKDTLSALLARLEAQAATYAEGDSLLRLAASDTLEFGRTLASTTRALSELRAGEASLVSAREAVAASLRETQARLAVEGAGDALGQILVLERRRLGSPELIERRLSDVRQALTWARLQLIALGDQRIALADLSTAVNAAVDSAEPASEGEAVALRGALYELLGERAELLPQLDSTLQRYIATLTHTEVQLQGQLADTRTLRDLLDRRIYWVPSNAPVDVAWMARLASGWADLLKPARFATSFSLLQARVYQAPWLPLFALAIIAACFWVRSHVVAYTLKNAPPLRRPAEDNYLFTWKALAVAVVAALPWVLLLATLGYLLRTAGEPGRFSDSLGRALLSVAGSLFVLEFLRWLVLEQGLAHLHFRWMRARRVAIARTLPWALALLLPLQFVVVLALIRNQELAIDTAARSALFGFCVVAIIQLHRLLAPGALWATRGGKPEPLRLRQLLRVGLIALFVVLGLLILNGYVYSGAVILSCLWWTLATLLAVGTLHGMLARWFLLGERRLVLKRVEARREAALSEASTQVSDEGAAGVVDEALAVQTVNVQTGRLLRALTLALWVGGLFWVWSEVLPALNRLDDMVLWQVSATAADGAAALEAISLRSVLFGLLVLALTIVAARNLPGLMELAVLSRISIDPASRYAIIAMSRYAIVIIGTVIGLGMLGLRWSQLHWMAAALTVGLGFGLQEIFANFVSGLILLSERPFRVGDVITIADQTGTVTRISTRATTLQDFDGKELVVPNKTFITDRLVNWTLSDTQTRVIIKVGVAYGTPPDRVHELLQRVATAHPLVLKEPAPRSWFMAFGASAMEFELRVFVAQIGDRLQVMNHLNGEIATLFADQGIEIAFPQLDLRVKEVPAAPPRDVEDSIRGGADS